MTGRVVVVGSINMDVVTRVETFPKPGETVLSDGHMLSPGGKGANQAVAAARLGACTAMVGCVGTDSYGTTIMKSLETAGVNREYVMESPSQLSGLALVTVDANGENCIVVSSGANMQLTSQHAERAIIQLKPDVLVLQLEIPLVTVVHAAVTARHIGATVLLNAAPVCLLPEELLSAVDVLVVNEIERDALARQYLGETGPLHANETLRKSLRVASLIVTKGRGGATLTDADCTMDVQGLPVTAVDTTGAGDAFVGALGAALSEGRPLIDALRFANAAGALTCCRVGTQESLPSRDDVVHMLAAALGAKDGGE